MEFNAPKRGRPPKEKVAEPTVFNVRTKAPTTRIHHCYTDLVFTPDPIELAEIDSWTQSQIDAGKLELC